VEIYIKIDQRL